MKTLPKIIEKPKERIKQKKNLKEFEREKQRIERTVNSRIFDHNDEYRRCEKTSDEGIEDRSYIRKFEIEGGRYIQKLARQYGIKNYSLNFKKLV